MSVQTQLSKRCYGWFCYVQVGRTLYPHKIAIVGPYPLSALIETLIFGSNCILIENKGFCLFYFPLNFLLNNSFKNINTYSHLHLWNVYIFVF